MCSTQQVDVVARRLLSSMHLRHLIVASGRSTPRLDADSLITHDSLRERSVCPVSICQLQRACDQEMDNFGHSRVPVYARLLCHKAVLVLEPVVAM